jgi:hypothetical protein
MTTVDFSPRRARSGLSRAFGGVFFWRMEKPSAAAAGARKPVPATDIPPNGASAISGVRRGPGEGLSGWLGAGARSGHRVASSMIRNARQRVGTNASVPLVCPQIACDQKRKWPKPRVPAKFEQGGFTSGRRKGPQTLFPGTSPGNHCRQLGAVGNRSRQIIACCKHGGFSAPLPDGISSGSSAKSATL